MRWLCVAGVLGGCSIEHALVSCPGDTLCPVGYVCEPVHGGCALPAQLSVCVGVANGDRCVADTVIGYCLDEICIDPTCGNRVVDPGEICDDGNRVDGDGCNATCVSGERCSDGAIDPLRDEECDDGNLISRDGCDSRCRQETTVWTIDEVGPATAIADWMTWDPIRARTVMVTDGFVWGWNGTRWDVLADNAPVLNEDYDVTFDVARGRLLVIAMQAPDGDILLANPPRDTLFEWDGTTWTKATLATSPEVGRSPADFVITYDPVAKQVFGFGIEGFDPSVRRAAVLDVATRMWKPLTPPAGTYVPEAGFDVAYDEARSRVVLVTAGTDNSNPVVHEWNGISWTSTAAAMTVKSAWTIDYDPTLQRVVAVGAETTAVATTVQSWTGTAWQTHTFIDRPRVKPGVVFDRTRQVRVVFGGSIDSTDEVAEWNGVAWRIAPRLAPPAGVDEVCASDEGLRRVVCTGVSGVIGPPQTWARTEDGMWSRLAKDLPDDTWAMTWDPVRRALVTWGTTSGPAALVGDSLQSISTSGIGGGRPTAMVFDPMTRDVVVTTTAQFVGLTETVRLAQDGTIHTFDSPRFDRLAFDARNASIIALDTSGVHRLVGDSWERVVGPGNGNTMVTNARRGTVEFISPGLRVLERYGSSWNELPGTPPRAVGGIAVMEQHSGELHVFGNVGWSRFTLHRRWMSKGSVEACTAGDDVDEDGLVGCDDRDCWDTCDACPPYTTCP